MKYLFRGFKNGYHYGNLVVRDGNAFIVNKNEDVPVYFDSISLASPFTYHDNVRIFEHDNVSYFKKQGVVEFSDGEFTVKFDNCSISLKEIFNNLEREE